MKWTNVVNPTPARSVDLGVLHDRVSGDETYYGLGFPVEISNGHRLASAAYAQLDHRLPHGVKLIGGFQANKINGDNLTNEHVWLPDWGGNTGDTIPARRGRTLYFGIEMSVGRRSGRPAAGRD